MITGGLVLASPALAEPDIFGREGLYDLTGDPLVEGLYPDLQYIRGEVPSYAERRGRVGAPNVEIRPNYIYIQDNDGNFPVPYTSGQDIQRSFNFALRETYRVLPDEFVFVYLFTSFDTRVGAFFYAPESNDVWGINAQGIFDSNGSSPREGFVFMNYWRSFEELFGGGLPAREQGRSVFNQEAGHRWGAFVVAGAGDNGAGDDVLLGRDDSHWSYFLNSGGSPMEGNTWRDNGDGTFTTDTGFRNWRFSDLDLYVMGLLPPEEVQPFFVIDQPDVGGQRDLYRRPLNRSSPPQIAQDVTISGTRVDMTIDDVITRNARRDPAYGESPDTWRVVFVMLASDRAPLSEAEKAEFDGMVEGYAEAFHEGTRQRGTLDYQLREPEEPLAPIGGVCDAIEDCNPDEANFCVPNPFTPTGLCTASCDSAASCPAQWCCSATQGTPVAVCLPEGLCPDPMPGCTCDMDPSACDPGCACDTMCQGGVDGGTGSGPDGGVASGADGGVGGGLCACDLTFSCDPNASGDGECACDPECGDDGCGCTSTGGDASGPAAALAGVLALFVVTRRRR